MKEMHYSGSVDVDTIMWVVTVLILVLGFHYIKELLEFLLIKFYQIFIERNK